MRTSLAVILVLCLTAHGLAQSQPPGKSAFEEVVRLRQQQRYQPAMSTSAGAYGEPQNSAFTLYPMDGSTPPPHGGPPTLPARNDVDFRFESLNEPWSETTTGAPPPPLPVRAPQPQFTGQSDLRIEHLNFILSAPDKSWRMLPGQELKNEVTLQFGCAYPEMATTIVAERASVEIDVDSKSMLALTQLRIRRKHPHAQFSAVSPASAHGLDGFCYSIESTLNGLPLHIAIWVAARNGYAYQVLTLGGSENASQIALANEMFRQLIRQIDPERMAQLEAGDLFGRFESTCFGYRADLTGLGFIPTDKREAVDAGFDLSADSGAASLRVVGVPLPGRRPNDEALALAAASPLMNFSPNAEVRGKTACQLGPLRGVKFDLVGEKDGVPNIVRVRAVADENCAYVLYGFAIGNQPKLLARIDQGLDRIEFFHRPAPQLAQWTTAQRAYAARILNDVGVAVHNQGDSLAAIDYFSAAVQLNPTSETFLINCVSALVEIDRTPEAIAMVERQLAQSPDNVGLRAMRAHLFDKSGRVDDAMAEYAAIISQGTSDEDILIEFMRLAVKAKAYDRAIAAVEQIAQRRPTLLVQRFRATLYGLNGDLATSKRLFNELRAKYPQQPEIAIDLADVLAEAGEHAAALAITQELIDAGHEDEQTLLTHGSMLLHLERNAEAKQWLERAKERYPQSEDARALVGIASNRLGQGENSGLKTPIEPVPIPSVVSAAIQSTPRRPTADIEKHGAEVLLQLHGIAYRKNAPLRTTSTCRVKVHTTSGVSRYSTLEFDLNPAKERIFVNRLVVLDDQGNLAAEGSVDSYFLVDDNESGIASQKKIVKIPVPGLKPGSTLEYTVTRQWLGPTDEFPFEQFALSASVPVGVSVFFVQGDVGELLCVGSVPMPIATAGDVLHCVLSNPPVYRYETQQQSAEYFVPIISVGQAGLTWESVAQEYLQSIDDKLTLDDSTRQLAADLTQDTSTSREKLAILAAHVQQAYSYQAIEFGSRGIIPNSAAKTLQLHYGDCKDHALLLRQLLASIGIPAHLAVVNASGPVVPELPSLDQFDHMILFVPGDSIDGAAQPGDGFFVDCTNKSAPPLAAPPVGLANELILVLDPHGPRLVRTPDYPPDVATFQSHRRITVVQDRSQRRAFSAEVQESITFNPHIASAVRRLFTAVAPGKRQEVMQELLSSNDKIRVRRVSIDKLEQTDQPLIVSLEYVVLDAFHTVASSQELSTLVGHIPSPWETRLLQPDYVESRETPFEVRVPILGSSIVQLNMPAGYLLADLERWNSSGRTSFSAWVSRARQTGSTVNLQYSMRLPAGRHVAAEYGDYYAAVRDSLSVLQSPITLQAEPAGSMASAGVLENK